MTILPFFLMAFLSILFLYLGYLQQTGIVGAFALMWSIGFLFYAVGEKLPIWKDYVGGGLIMAFLGSAVLVHYGLISDSDAQYLTDSVIGNRFLYFLLVGLVAGTILTVDRRTLLQSLAGLFPVIICALSGATLLGVGVGIWFDVEPARIITHYVLPIMSGGNGAGAIPMSEIYADTTGQSGATYYGFAISVLTIANFVAILFGSLLNQIGEKFPALTGNGTLGRRQANNVDEYIAAPREDTVPTEAVNTQSALFFIVGLLLLAMLLYAVLPQIHLFAWAVALVVLLNVLDILPQSLVHALDQVNRWGMKTFIVLVLVAVGVMTDLGELVAALTLANLIIAASIVFGAALGAGLSSRFFGLHTIEASIAAGLCMANRGGSGDLEVLGASKRMALYPYSQISSRIGGGLVLFLAGYLFNLLL